MDNLGSLDCRPDDAFLEQRQPEEEHRHQCTIHQCNEYSTQHRNQQVVSRRNEPIDRKRAIDTAHDDRDSAKAKPAARMPEQFAPLSTIERHDPWSGRCRADMALFYAHSSSSQVIRTTKNDSDLTPQRASSGVATRLCRGFTRLA